MRSAEISATLAKIDISLCFRSAIATAFSGSDCAYCVRRNAVPLRDVLNLGVRIS
jgi:hypothetical protein